MGDALSPGPEVKPLAAAAVKEVRLDTTHQDHRDRAGREVSAWTFGDQVPGPIVRAKIGDRIRFTMTNRSDEAIPGMRVTAGADDAFDGLPLRARARRVKGIDATTWRSSQQPAAVSFAVDPKRTSPERALAELQKALPSGRLLSMVRVAG